jgi:hypothetical protein
VAQVKSDIHREMDAADLGKVKTEFENAARSFQTEVETHAKATEQEVSELQKALDRDVADATTAITPEPEPLPAPAPEPAAEPASPQLELGIEAPESVPARKHASG